MATAGRSAASRRGFLETVSRAAASTAALGFLLGSTGLRNAHAAGDDEIRVAEASLMTAMGRIAAHVGKSLTYHEALDWGDDLTAAVAGLSADSPAPVQADAEGRYPVPRPGRFRYECHN